MNADILSAVRQMLIDDAEVGDLVDERVWGGDLDREEVANMPRKNIVISRGGSVPSVGTASYIRVQRMRLDIRCYGEDSFEAGKVQRAVEAFMKAITPRVVELPDHSVYVQNAVESGGPIDLVDPDVDWPSVYCAWGVIASEEAIAPVLVSS